MVYRCAAPDSAEISCLCIPTLEREVLEPMNRTASAFSGTRARWFRRSVASLSCLLLVGLILVGSGCSDDDGGNVNYPDPPAEEQRDWLFDVYGTAPNDVYAVGNKGAMFHYDGTDWTAVPLAVTSPLTSIWGPGDGTLYSVGHGGVALRYAGGQWSGLESGTENDLYTVGMFQDEIYACGEAGTVRRLSGNAMVDVAGVIIVRNGETGAPEDTLSLGEDIYSLVTVNYSFIGGAYILPDYEEEIFGIMGTDGMVLAPDNQPELYDWRLRPIGSDQFALSEWILCTTSDPVTISNNYMGTSEGWIYRLNQGEGGQLDWSLIIPDATVDGGNGIRDMWIDESCNLYAVTDDGNMVFQTPDYDFVTGEGVRAIFDVTHGGLTGIWGSGPDNLFMTGFNENVIVQASMNLDDYTLTFDEVPVVFPSKGGESISLGQDHQGLPRF